MTSMLVSATFALWKREVVKFLRDRSRVLGSLAQPIGFWLLLGLGFQGTFQVADGSTSYSEFLFPGIIAMVVLFTAIFSTIAVVEERKSGFIQAALVAPAPRMALVLGNVLGGTTLALVEALLFVLLAPLAGIHPSPAGIAGFLLLSFLLGVAFTSLGYTMAWRLDSTRGFHGVMNLFLLPLWFLSSAPFPVDGAHALIGSVMKLNPVYYGVSAMRAALYLPGPAPVNGPDPGVSTLVTAGFALAMLALAVVTVVRQDRI